MKTNIIYNEDCLSGMDKLENDSVDCVWIDPPYNIDYKYEEYDDTLKEDEYKELLEACFSRFQRILKDGGVVFVKQFWKNMPLMFEIGCAYFKFYNMIIWANSSPAQPKTNYKPTYEPIFMFVKGEHPKYFNDKFETRTTIMPWSKKRLENYFGKIGNIWDDIPYVYGGSIKHPEAVYKPGTTEKEHPAQHPIKLVTRSIGFVTKEGDVVLDCFMGSGTTAVACKQLNRKYIGFEISEKYCEIANKRLSQGNLTSFLSQKENDK